MSSAQDLRPVAPTRLAGARPGGLYGMGLFLLVLSVVAGALLYGYAHLAANSDGWPPEGTETPGHLVLAAIAVLWALGAAATTLAFRHAHDDAREQGHVVGAQLVSAVLGAVATALLVIWLARLPHGTDHAYGASVVVLGWFVAIVGILGTAGAVLVAVWMVRGHSGTPPADSVRILRALHWYTVALAVVVFVALAWGAAG